MLPYLWLLLPTLASAAHRVPRSHGSHWNLTPRELASSTAPSTVLAIPSASDSPCKRVSLAAQPSNDTTNEPGGRVPAELAYECLNSIPFNRSAAAALLESMRPYLEWQSSTSYVKDPPEKYVGNVQPPYDLWSAFDAIEANVAHGTYDSEYDFGWDLFQATQQVHDTHFIYMPYVVSQLFSFGRTTPLVSVSENGRDSPLVYAYTDILDSYAGNSSVKPSHIIQIDGKDATDFLLDWSQYGTAQDKDALWNDVFYSLAQVSLGEEGSGTGTFTGNSLGRFVYPGPTTTLTFANGSQTTTENFARVLVSLSGIVEGADMYQKFLSPPFEAYRNALDVLHDDDDEDDDNDTRISSQARHICPHYHAKVDKLLPPQRPTPTTPAIGYPSPVIRQKQNLNGGYFLGEPGLEDVAVLTVSSFYPQGEKNEQNFQKINSDFIAAALAANKTKLIIDVSANGGGNPFQSFDLFKQLFPSIHPYGASRMRAHESIDWLGKLYSAPVNQSNSDSPSLDEKLFWDYHTDLDSDDRPFSSWKQKYGPHPKGPANDTFTSLIRFNLNDKEIREYSDGIWVTGYGSRSNITHQPFQPQNIVLVTDGACGSACAFFAEFLQQEAGVQTIALGGRPSAHPMQGIGGVRGGHVFSWELIFQTVAEAAFLADPVLQQDLNQTALARYSLLPAARGTGSVNFRDVIRRNDDEQTPLQFLYEPAQCRIFYTKSMVIDQSAVWKTVADTEWGQGTFCIASDNSFPGTQRNLTAESEAGREKIWSVRPDFDIKEAWEGLKVETGRDWYGAIGEHAMVR